MRFILPAAGLALFAAAFVLPTAALLVRCVTDDRAPIDGYVLSARQGVLLAKSVGTAVLSVAIALAASVPGAYAVGRIGRPSCRPLVGVLLAAPLLFPPMIYVFGWMRLVPGGLPERLLCIGVWALWACPIPALLVGSGWARQGRTAYEAALLDASSTAAFTRAALPVLTPHVAGAAAILLVIFLGDYGVPHACALPIYATELLAWSEQSRHPIDALWPALPLLATILAALAAAGWAGKRAAEHEAPVGDAVVGGTSLALNLLAAGGFVLAVVVPITALTVGLGSIAAMTEAFRTYVEALAHSIAVSGLSGLLVCGMGVALVMRRARRLVWVWVIAFGVLPGALVGETLLAAYQTSRWGSIIYDYWPIVVLGYVARFGWIGLVAAWAASATTPRELIWQARADGADEAGVTLHVRAALSWPTLAFGACLAGALALAEVPTSSLVRVPSVGLIAHVLMEKFHRFEDDMLISLSLWLAAAAVPAALLLAVVLRRSRSG